VPRSKNGWSYTSTPQYAFMAWCSVKKAQGQLYLYLLIFLQTLPKLLKSATTTTVISVANLNKFLKNYHSPQSVFPYFSYLMKPENSTLCSQELAIGPYL
jgi:hypothetical protein